MTQAEAQKIEKEVREGLRIIGLGSEQPLLIPKLPSEPPKSQPETITEYRTLIGNSSNH